MGKALSVYVLLAAGILALDQAVKYLVAANMKPGESIPVIRNVFHLTFVRNTGAAFGILTERINLFVIVTVIVLGIVIYFFRQLPPGMRLMKVSLAMVAAGALGNMIDRLRFAYVIDYLDFRIWPVFNVADTAIVIGIIIFIYTYWQMD